MQEVNKAAAMLDLMMDEIGQKSVVDGAVEAFLGKLFPKAPDDLHLP